MKKRTLAVLAVAAAAGVMFPFGLPKTAAAAPLVVGYDALVFAPLPIEQPGTLPASNSVTICVQPQSGGVHLNASATVYLSINSGQFTAPTVPGGSAMADGTPLTVNPQMFTTSSTCSYANAETSGTIMWAVPVTYTAPSSTPIDGRDVIIAADSPSDVTITTPTPPPAPFGTCNGAGVCNTGTYVFSAVTSYTFSTGATIATTGNLTAGQVVHLTVTPMDSTSHPVPGAFLDLSLSSSGASSSSATAVNTVNGVAKTKAVNNSTGNRFGADNTGSVAITYIASNPLATGGIVDTLTAQNHPIATVHASTTYTYSGSSTPPSTGPYTAITPLRVCDTRPVGGTIASNQCNGVGQGPLGSAATRIITIDGQGSGTIPGSGVTAVVVNVTVVNPSVATFVTLFPDGTTRPTTSNLTPRAGSVVANLVEVAVSTAGKIDVFNDAGTTNVILDVEGYVSSASTDLFSPVTPARICDTRAPGTGIAFNQCDHASSSAPLGAGGVLTFAVHTSTDNVPATADAVVLNLTAIGPSVNTVLTAYPADVARPNASTVNLNAHATLPNRVIVRVSATGTVSIWNSAGSVNVAVDIDGWFATSGGPTAQFTALPPARVCDTRFGNGSDSGCAKATIGAGHVLTVDVTGIDGVPPTTGHAGDPIAVVVNVTVIAPGSATFVTVYPGLTGRPNASDLNAAGGQVSTNLVVAEVGTDGTINLYNAVGNVNLVVDVMGYYS